MTAYFDRRQQILSRIFANLGTLSIPLLGGPNGPVTIVPGNIVHNRNELPAEKVPGIILLDADEVRDTRQMQPPPGLVQRAVPSALYKMTPEIYVVLDVRPVSNDGANMGEDLNTARLAILGATLPDTYLQELVSANGNIVYDGCVTDLARNRTMKGQLGISISFVYPLLPNEYIGIN